MAERTTELERALAGVNAELVTTTARFEEARKEIRPRAAKRIAELQAELDGERQQRAEQELRATEELESARASHEAAIAEHELVLARHEVAAGEREAALADREEELSDARRRLSDAEETLMTTTIRLERVEEERASLKHELVALREHERTAGATEQERLAVTRRRLTALDEHLSGAIGSVSTVVIPEEPRAVSRPKALRAPKRKPKPGNGRPRHPGEVPPVPPAPE